MITKWIQFAVAPKDAAEFREALVELEEASKAEAGCAHYAAFQSREEEAVFTVLESWETAEALEAHRGAAHMKAFKERCAAMILSKSGQSLAAVAEG